MALFFREIFSIEPNYEKVNRVQSAPFFGYDALSPDSVDKTVHEGAYRVVFRLKQSIC